VDTKNELQAKRQYVEFLKQRIDMETAKIQEGRRKDREYTDVLLDLRDEIRRARDEVRGLQSKILEEDDRIRRRRAELDSLLAEAETRKRRISELENEIAEARAIRQHDPWSIFPIRGGLLAAYEIGDTDRRFVVGLSHDVFDLRDLRFGLEGTVGLSSEEERSLKEGGIYLNIPLVFRRASIEVAAGISGVQEGATPTQYDPYLSGTFRLAPIRRERFFLVGGPHLTTSSTAFRLGVAFGRR